MRLNISGRHINNIFKFGDEQQTEMEALRKESDTRHKQINDTYSEKVQRSEEERNLEIECLARALGSMLDMALREDEDPTDLRTELEAILQQLREWKVKGFDDQSDEE